VPNNDTDVDLGDEKRLAAVDTTGVAGTVKINTDGTLSYQAGSAFQYLAAGATATERIGYTLKDQWGASSDAVVTVTVVGTNDAVNAVADSAMVNEYGDQAVVDVLANDLDPDAGDTKTMVDIAATGLAGSAILNSDGTVVIPR
jgi:VCBS repeat-containing protein